MLVGTVLLRLWATGIYRRYVRVGMGPWLAIAGVAVLVLGGITLIRSLRRGNVEDAHGHGGDGHSGHGGGEERMGWLLLAPIAALLLVAPPTLGSYGVDRGSPVDIRAGNRIFAPLPAASRPTPLTLLEFSQRASDHAGASMAAVTIELTGFVAAADSGAGFRLARYQIACCAADAAPVVVRIVNMEGPPPSRDQWVTATGTFRPGGSVFPELAVTALAVTPTPEDPYE